MVAVLCAAASQPQGKGGSEQPQTKQPSAQAAPPSALPNPGGTDRLNAACEQGEDNRASELCAQWKAADAAEQAARASDRSAFWAQVAGIATLIGLVVGAVTMGAAIFAAWFAKEAADHTQDGALQAKRSADTAETAWLGLDRPVLVMEVLGQAEEDADGRATPVTCCYRNVGRVAGRVIHEAHRFAVVDDPNGMVEPISLKEARGRRAPWGEVLGPGENSPPARAGPFFKGKIGDLELKAPGLEGIFEKRTFFYGYVIYGDLNNRHYVHGFCFDCRSGHRFERTGYETQEYNYDRPLTRDEQIVYPLY